MHAFWMITLVFGIVSSIIAYGKGRNSLGWFLAGSFLGPFALIVAFLNPVEREGMFATCPACREVVREAAMRCHHCQSGLDADYSR
ncbi:MAG: hypothetical protein DRJ42_28905 [Deltaproteobacteria bacterium]|nr:MAG: hypothetical protein DRJ42_28905 [Deltaproteobacteria bacterium]